MKKIESVLLIDDDNIANFLHTRVMQLSGVTNIKTALNGREALVLLSDFKPSLMLVDINMPVMDGFQFIEEIQKQNLDQNILVAILSSSSKQADIDKANSLNVAFIEKPLDMEKVNSLIANMDEN
ncbi:MAG: response regulator [Bacteroidetes bacterium]|nr:response regulator [Bacteroidota bacterium]